MKTQDDTLQKCCDLLTDALNVDCFYMSDNGTMTETSVICRQCRSLQKEIFSNVECEKLHSDSLVHSEKWGGHYEYLCPLGMVFVCSAVMIGGKARYVIIVGPLLMIDYEDFLDEDLPGLFHDHSTEELIEVTKFAPYIRPGRVESISEIVRIITNNVVGMAQLHLLEPGNGTILGIDTYEMLYQDKGDLSVLQGINEQKLITSMTEGDATESDRVANDILSEIYFSSNGDLGIIKKRLNSLLSCIFVEAITIGSNVSTTLMMYKTYLEELEVLGEAEIDLWFLYVIQNMIKNVFPLHRTKNKSIIDMIKNYISNNYMTKIRLNDIADTVMLSAPYMCKIFKESTFMSIGAYINLVRVNSAKKMLIDIDISLIDVASMVGFDDQSYFTKIFKKIEGISPGRFRQLNLDKEQNGQE